MSLELCAWYFVLCLLAGRHHKAQRRNREQRTKYKEQNTKNYSIPFPCSINKHMPREITDRGRVVQAVQKLTLTADLFEEQNGKQKYGSDLEAIVQGRDYGNGKRVGPYVRLLAYDGGEHIMRQGEWGGNTFYIAVDGALDVYVREGEGQKKIGRL